MNTSLSRPDEPYQILPPLTCDEYEALKADIAERGVMIAVDVDEQGVVLDGHHRARAASELGINYPVVVRSGLTEVQKRQHARRANLLRRHLTRDQRRQVIVDVIADEPDLSDRAVGRLVGCSPSTVGAVRVSNLDSGKDVVMDKAAAEKVTAAIRTAIVEMHDLVSDLLLQGGLPLTLIGALTAVMSELVTTGPNRVTAETMRQVVYQPQIERLLELHKRDTTTTIT
jgi:ParB-like chromosome segregation protein Spo0J